MSLRDEVAKIIETENSYGYYAPDRAKELADFILALIDEHNQVQAPERTGNILGGE